MPLLGDAIAKRTRTQLNCWLEENTDLGFQQVIIELWGPSPGLAVLLLRLSGFLPMQEDMRTNNAADCG